MWTRASLLSLTLLTSCRAASPRPVTAEPPEPFFERVAWRDAKVDRTPLLQAGCVELPEGLDCTRGALKQLGCLGPSKVEEALGALTPMAGIAECNIREGDGLDEGLVSLGCRWRVARRYLVASGGKVSLIKSEAELAARFAPVETPEEALAFALALSEGRVLREVVIPRGAKAIVSRVDPTYVEKTRAGFKVRLFDVRVCGCGPHNWEAIDWLVTREGEVKEIGRQAIYADPELAGVCAD